MDTLPVLKGWWTLPEAADYLEVKRQRFYQMVQEKKVQSVHQLGRRPIYVVREAEIRELKRLKQQAENEGKSLSDLLERQELQPEAVAGV
jgi:Helix-turn-helix domain